MHIALGGRDLTTYRMEVRTRGRARHVTGAYIVVDGGASARCFAYPVPEEMGMP